MKILIIDNFDSFTFNLYQYIGEILTDSGQTFELHVIRNNQWTLQQVKDFAPEKIIISPGPGSPDQPEYFGICGDVITQLGKTIPTLGVCLGMQGIAHFFGAKVTHADIPMHGKTSPISHTNTSVFLNLPQSMSIMRYHSLVVEAQSIPQEIEVTAHVEGHPSQIMGIRHTQYPIHGIQFHPESFATEHAHAMIENFLFHI